MERNVIIKRGRKYFRVALLYPSKYRVALSSLSFQTIYFLVNMDERFAAERVVEDWAPRSIETGTSLDRFDYILVSMHYELDYASLARILMEAGIPPRKKSREDGHPLIIAGGPPVTANPRPIEEIVDAAVIGEAEPVMPVMLDALASHDKRRVLEELASLRGLYVPGLGETPVRRVYAERLDDVFHPVAQIQSEDVEPIWGRSLLVETGRGCPWLCRFCMEAHLTYPRRERSYGRVEEIVRRGVEVNNVGKVSLYDLAFLNHRDSRRILELVVEELGLEISVPSLRADLLDPERASLIARGGQRTLTIAPETPCPRLARALGKASILERLREVVKMAEDSGFKSVKLYYMVGLPCEPGDVAERIAEEYRVLRSTAPSLSLKVSVTPFMPKPHTPLQSEAMAPLEKLRRTAARLRRLLGPVVSIYDPRFARIQVVLSRGGPELSDLIIEWAARGGGLGAWRAAARAVGLDVERYTGRISDPAWVVVDPGLPERLLEAGRDAYFSQCLSSAS